VNKTGSIGLKGVSTHFEEEQKVTQDHFSQFWKFHTLENAWIFIFKKSVIILAFKLAFGNRSNSWFDTKAEAYCNLVYTNREEIFGSGGDICTELRRGLGKISYDKLDWLRL